MEDRTVFKRYELKYLLTREQKAQMLCAISQYLTPDAHGRTTIRNVYFDTDNYRLARASIEKPYYKEKLRIRSYALAAPETPVFVELKKKVGSVVYKRRLTMPEGQAMRWVAGDKSVAPRTQIASEIDSFIDYYGTLRPAAFLTYDREAYFDRADDTFRVTFDGNILCREDGISLELGAWGQPLLEGGMALMEVKCAGGIPLWMTRVLSDMRLYKTSFSKYGTAYASMIYPRKENRLYA